MLKLLGFDVNKWVIYAIGLVVGVVSLAGVYLFWKHNITAAAQLRFNNKQLEQTIKDKDQFIANLERLSKLNEEAIVELNKQKGELDVKFKDLQDYLNSEEARKDDRDSSQVLKKTIEKLRKL
jgi:hypothetical protein